MADTTALKNRIRAAIKANDNQEITGPVLQQALLDIVDELNGATETEAQQRQSADSTLQQSINTEAGQRQSADSTLSGMINSETQQRQSADSTLQQSINTETGQRQSADTQLNNLITGIKNNIDNGYVYAGIATPSTTPVSGKVFYIAIQAGTYTNYGELVVIQGINILKYNGSVWSKDVVIGIDNKPTCGNNNIIRSEGVAIETYEILSGLSEVIDIFGKRTEKIITLSANAHEFDNNKAIDISGISVIVAKTYVPYDTNRPFAIFDASQNIIKYWAKGECVKNEDGTCSIYFVVPTNAKYFQIARFNGSVQQESFYYLLTKESIKQLKILITQAQEAINTLNSTKLNAYKTKTDISDIDIKGIGAWSSTDGTWNSSATAFLSTYKLYCKAGESISFSVVPTFIYFWNEDESQFTRIFTYLSPDVHTLQVPNGMAKISFVYCISGGYTYPVISINDIIGSNVSNVYSNIAEELTVTEEILFDLKNRVDKIWSDIIIESTEFTNSMVKGVGAWSSTDGTWNPEANFYWSSIIMPCESVIQLGYAPSFIYFWNDDTFITRISGVSGQITVPDGANKVAFVYALIDNVPAQGDTAKPMADVIGTSLIGCYTSAFEDIESEIEDIKSKIEDVDNTLNDFATNKADKSDIYVDVPLFTVNMVKGVGGYSSTTGEWNPEGTSFWSTFKVGCKKKIQLGYAPAFIYFWKYDGSFISRIVGTTNEITVPSGATHTAFMYTRFDPSPMPASSVIGTSMSGITINPLVYIDKPAEIGMHYFTVEVNGNLNKDSNKGENYVTDYCAVRIPYYYRRSGTPHRLIIVNHGAGGGVTPNSATRISATNNTFGYLSSLGYVMLEVNGLPSDLWEDWMHDGKGCSMAGPITMRCIEKAYQYVIEHFNVYDDGCFIYGASMGGLVTNNLLNNSNIPILAVALDAPVIDMYLDAWNSPWFSRTQLHAVVALLYGFDNFRIENDIPQFSIDSGTTWINFAGSAQDIINIYYYQNLEKVIAYNPPYNKRFSANPDADVSGIVLPQVPSEGNAGVTDGVTTFDYLRYSVVYKAPLKIWHGVDDATNYHRLSVNFVKLVQNGGQYAEMRSCPTSTHGVINEIPTGEAVVKGDFTISPYGFEMALWFANHGGYKCV